jgi:hypothetical protein
MALARLMVQAELLTMKRWYRHDYSRQSPQMGGQAKAAGRSAPGF